MVPQRSLNVLVVGGGGREHAIVQACLASPLVSQILAAPGNAGIADQVDTLPLAVEEVDALATAAEARGVNFAIIGPEVPLCLGLADKLAAKGILAFGPSAAIARLEGSKVHCKEFLLRHRIPTATAEIHNNADEALASLAQGSGPIVVKADGLAAGKGVVVAADRAEAARAVREMMVQRVFGEAGNRILLEETLEGKEASIHVLLSGRDYILLPTSQDHKRVGAGDTGPNTGGMGAYSPAGWVDAELMGRIEREIVRPTVEGFLEEGIDYRGVLFIGVMVTAKGPKVLEFNCRFGDPETEVLLPRFASDPVAALHATARGGGALGREVVAFRRDCALCVVVASRGYPGNFTKGLPLRVPAGVRGESYVFHSGTTRNKAGRPITSGGRVLVVTGLGRDMSEAARRAYEICERVEFEQKYYRPDIGWQVLSPRS